MQFAWRLIVAHVAPFWQGLGVHRSVAVHVGRKHEKYKHLNFWVSLILTAYTSSQWGLFTKWPQPWGIPPAARAPAGQLLRSAWHAPSGQALLSRYSRPLAVKKPQTNENLSGSTPPSRHNADFCFHRATISDTERSDRPASVGNLWRSSRGRRWLRYFGKTELISMHGVTQRSQGSQCVFNLQEHFFFVKFDSRTMETEHYFSCSFRCQWLSPLYTCNSELARSGRREGGRKTVTKANNRKHKSRTAKTLGVEPFPVGKTKENKTQAKVSLAADNRSPCRRSAVLYRCFWVLHCSLSLIRNNGNILLELFLWLDFSSSSNTEIVCKY